MMLFKRMSVDEARSLYERTREAKKDFMSTHDMNDRECINQVQFMTDVLNDLYFFTDGFLHDY